MKTLELGALCIVGAVGAHALASPIDAATAEAYLSEVGYTEIRMSGAAESCGKSKRRFRFTARTPEGKPGSGGICLDAFPFFTSIQMN